MISHLHNRSRQPENKPLFTDKKQDLVGERAQATPERKLVASSIYQSLVAAYSATEGEGQRTSRQGTLSTPTYLYLHAQDSAALGVQL